MTKLWLIAAAAGLLLADIARAGEIQGQAALPNRRPAVHAVVTLEGAIKALPMTKAVIDQREKIFSPHVSVVTVGTTVEFPNNDTVFHNVFAYYNAKKFDLGMYPRGATKRVTFEKPGLVAVLCNVHSEMSAYIMVVETPYHAVTDKQGRFRIGSVPPGSYTLRVWHESGASYSQTLEVKDKHDSLALALARK